MAACFAGGTAARGEVTVVEDEVIFTLAAPGARTVYLVGTFNNWNPTVELMTREGDTFTAALFLVPEEYHYKFVVDGAWITDPDNPPADPEKGSPLSLVERGGVLTIKSRGVESVGGERAFIPGVRYRGTAMSDDGEESADQEIDLRFDVGNELARARALLKSRDSSWHLSPLDAEIVFDRGSLELKTAKGVVRGVENDSLWTSRDPLRLFGRVGIYNQNFGFGRRSISVEQVLSKIHFRAVYADRLGGPQQGVGSIPKASVEEALSPEDAPRAVYRTNPGLADEDAFGGELFLDAGDVALGYGWRTNRGMNAGLLARFGAVDSMWTAEVCSTREYWNGSVVWADAALYGPFRLALAYGSGTAEALCLSRSIVSFDQPDSLTPGAGTEPAGQKIPFQKSRRWTGGIGYGAGKLAVSLDIERSTFEYIAPIFKTSKAEIVAGSIDIRYRAGGWALAGRVRYLDQSYREVPDEFHIYSRDQNYWLDYDDQLTVERMAGFDLDRYTTFGVECGWNREGRRYPPFSGPSEGQSLYGSLTGVVENVAGDMHALFARVAYERFLRPRVYLQLDGRLATYPQATWREERTFTDIYVEVGYRSGGMEISLGVGFDPVVFDDRSNRYLDIGRTEFLRTAAGERRRNLLFPDASGPESGLAQPALMEYNLLALEDMLEETGTVKLEWILEF